MRRSLTAVVVLVLTVFAHPMVSSAQTTTPKKAIDVYREYQAAAKTAKTLAPVLPFLTAEYRANLSGAPKDMQDRMLKGFQQDAGWFGIVVTKETVKGSACELQTTAKGPDGKTMVGKIAFLKESGEWRIEGQGWVPDYSDPKNRQ
jgi:hypothetical protein